jgi:hypothetical protein
MLKFSSTTILGTALLLALLILTQGAPFTFADHGSCSGVNYYSCVTGGRWGSVGSGGYINDPTPGGICTCSGCLCVGHDVIQATNGSGSTNTSGNPALGAINTATGVPAAGGSAIGLNYANTATANTSGGLSTLNWQSANTVNWGTFYSGLYDVWDTGPNIMYYNYGSVNPISANPTNTGSLSAGGTSGGTGSAGGGSNLSPTPGATTIRIDPVIGAYYSYPTTPYSASPDRMVPNVPGY